MTRVSGYTRSDGTYVRPYIRGGGSGGYSTYTPVSLTFGSCAEARSSGFSNIPRGSASYSSGLDRDGDGIACEAGEGGSSTSSAGGVSFSTSTMPRNSAGGPPRPAQAVAGVAYFAARDLKTSGAVLTADGKKYTLQFSGHAAQLELGNTAVRVDQQTATLNAAPILHAGKLYVPVRLVEKLGCAITEVGANFFGAECKNYVVIGSDDILVW
ncbi:excalibur calcium-binding domain-containing protein [Deinococcus sp. HMF7604]|uniref:excalibur calcium-binding domain-containing protein n=1 Tax=Deinococcus betulae TaxID=2873312 RepID=UPI001CCD4CFF|nr:excalibur calcium-binding domain-containing protein [Deinococcus betulae]